MKDRVNFNVTIAVMAIGVSLLVSLFIALANGNLYDTSETLTFEPTSVSVELDDKVIEETENASQSENKANIKKGRLM